MPLYEYQCATCNLHFERRQAFSDTSLPVCPNGHDQVHRIYRAPGIVFKGTGWYVTDSRKPSPASNAG